MSPFVGATGTFVLEFQQCQGIDQLVKLSLKLLNFISFHVYFDVCIVCVFHVDCLIGS